VMTKTTSSAYGWCVTCSPTYALRLRGGGFSFKTGIPGECEKKSIKMKS